MTKGLTCFSAPIPSPNSTGPFSKVSWPWSMVKFLTRDWIYLLKDWFELLILYWVSLESTLIRWRHKWWRHRKSHAICVLTAKSQFYGFQPLNAAFLSFWSAKVKIWTKSENLTNPKRRPPVASFIWLLLPWKSIRHHVVPLNWKYKWSLLHVPSFMSIGWILLKVEGWWGSDWLPPPLKA